MQRPCRLNFFITASIVIAATGILAVPNTGAKPNMAHAEEGLTEWFKSSVVCTSFNLILRLLINPCPSHFPKPYPSYAQYFNQTLVACGFNNLFSTIDLS
jgi:hypothetical protein